MMRGARPSPCKSTAYGPLQLSFITRQAGKAVAPSNAARGPGLLCNQQEKIMSTRKSGAKGPARAKQNGNAKHSGKTKPRQQSATAVGTTVSGPSLAGSPASELAE